MSTSRLRPFCSPNVCRLPATHQRRAELDYCPAPRGKELGRNATFLHYETRMPFSLQDKTLHAPKYRAQWVFTPLLWSAGRGGNKAQDIFATLRFRNRRQPAWLTEYSKKGTGLNQARQAPVLFSARQETPDSSASQEEGCPSRTGGK